MVKWLYLSRQLWIAIAVTLLGAGLVALRAAQTELVPPYLAPLFFAAHASGPFAAFIMDPAWAIASPFVYVTAANVLLPIVYFECWPRGWLRPIAIVAYLAWFILGFCFAYALTT